MGRRERQRGGKKGRVVKEGREGGGREKGGRVVKEGREGRKRTVKD